MPTNPNNASLDIARSFFTAYAQHDINRMLEAFSEDAELRYPPLGPQGEGRARDLGKQIWTDLIDTFPDLHVKVQSMFGDEGNVAAEVLIGGTQSKDFHDIHNQGRHYEVPIAFLLRIDKGLIAEIAAYWDNMSFYSQLGKEVVGKAA